METEAEISVETQDPPTKKKFFGFSIEKIIILIVLIAIVAAFLVVAFIVIFKYLGLFGTSKEPNPKGCKNCKDKKPEKQDKASDPEDDPMNQIDKMISENNTKMMENITTHDNPSLHTEGSLSEKTNNPNQDEHLQQDRREAEFIEERQKLLNVEVKNEDNITIDESTSAESEFDSE